jgi:catechol 2,3-dioxygenase-like lactoylglutathione lyase family enzyme
MVHHINIQVSDREQTREWYDKVLGAEFIDRGPTLNLEQLRFRIGNSEVHTNDTANPVQVSAAHFAVEIADWDEMIAHLDKLEIPYSTSPTSPPRAGEKSS